MTRRIERLCCKKEVQEFDLFHFVKQQLKKNIWGETGKKKLKDNFGRRTNRYE